MKIVEPSVEIYFHHPSLVTIEHGHTVTHDPILPEKFLERVGRTCYKSEDKITVDSAAKFIQMLDGRKHKAMLEHCYASVKFICDRGVTHELVRHRLVSYAQESTRYCNYTKDKFGNEISGIEPPFKHTGSREIWEKTLLVIEDAYQRLIENGEPPQLARAVLPISVKTEIWASANLREWQHIFGLRCAEAAHPQIRALMGEALDIFRYVVPSMFVSLWKMYSGEEK